MDFTCHIPVRLLFGAGKLALVGEETARLGHRAFIVTSGSAHRSGVLQRVLDALAASGVEAAVFDRVQPNPLTTTAEEGAMRARAIGADAVIGLGGGSALDTAKAIAFLAKNEGNISDYIFLRKTGTQALPLVLIPTTCGTGSEGNHFAVLTNPQTGDKKSLRCEPIYGKTAIIDPQLMTTLPRSVAASVGFDAFSHCMEAFYAKASQPITDCLALRGMRLLAQSLPRVLDDPADLDAWAEVTVASTLGGMCIGAAGVGAVHGLEHPVSGLRNVTHGLGLAALTPEILRRSVAAAPEKLAAIAGIFGGSDETQAAEVLTDFMTRIGVQTTLGKLGVLPGDVEWMTDNCQRVSAPSVQNHPVTFTTEEIRDIYTCCL